MDTASGTASPRYRNELTTFLLLTFGLSTIFYVIFARAKSLSAGGGLYVAMLMWCPGTLALITRLLFQRNVRGEGWAWGKTRYVLIGFALPLAYAGAAYGAVWIFDFGGVDVSRFHANPIRFITIGLAMSLAFATGEELGWRGFLVPKLAERMSFRGTAITSGVIWATWHMPLIIFADYNGGTPTILFDRVLRRDGRGDRLPIRVASPAFRKRVARRHSPRDAQSLHSGLLRHRDRRHGPHEVAAQRVRRGARRGCSDHGLPVLAAPRPAQREYPRRLTLGYRRSGNAVGVSVSTGSETYDANRRERKMLTVAALKSESFASKMLGTNVCGFLSMSGNQLLCTCTMIRCPLRNR